MKKIVLLFMMMSCFNRFSFSQNAKIDSLSNLLQNSKEDTSRVNYYTNLCAEFRLVGETDQCLEFASKALALSAKLKFPKGIAASYGKIGLFYSDQGDYSKALEYYYKALTIFEELEILSQIAATNGNMGIAYHSKGDIPRAMEFYFKALKINEAIGNKKNIAANTGNIGAIYSMQGDYKKALEYHFKALKIKEEIGNKNGIASTLGNIGNDYSEMNDDAKAKEYYLMALALGEELGNKNIIGINLGNLGNIYKELQDYEKALGYYFRALKINEELNDKSLIANNYGNIGSSYLGQKKYIEAEKYLSKGLSLSKAIGTLELTKKLEQSISDLYFKKGEYKNAYEHHQQFLIVKDSLFNIEKYEDATRKEMNYEYEKKETSVKAEKEKQEALAAVEIKKQRIILWSVVLGLILVIVVTVFIFRSLRISIKQKRIIEKQKILVEEQKHIVEEKHKEISDSINYAERIQRALLASKDILDQNLNRNSINANDPSYFILFKPKDVVSGDFYWASKIVSSQGVENFIIATADSTGHGVPGAIMSILNIACLKEAVGKGISAPDELLNETRRLIIENLKNDGSAEGGKDGMDASLLCLDFSSLQEEGKVIMQCASANNPVWIISGDQLNEIKPNRMPVGKHDKDQIPFNLQTITLQKGDLVYTLTDGFSDQFGGKGGKKFKYKPLQELLLSISHEPMELQKQKLDTTFEAWKGNLEQVDDVCIIGFRI